MKSKYKIGTLIEMKKNDGESGYGKITAIMTKADGISFVVDRSGAELNVQESEIINAFHSIKPKTRRRRTKSAIDQATQATK